jgi:uncharacterized protein (TIGR03437 family)
LHHTNRFVIFSLLALPLAAQDALPGWTINTVGGASYDAWGTRPASEFSFQALSSVAVDSKGNVYIAASYDARVYKMTPDGMMSVFAGSGAHTFGEAPPGGGFLFSDDPKKATVGEIRDMAVDPNDNLLLLRHLYGPLEILSSTNKIATAHRDLTYDTFGSSGFSSPPASLAIANFGQPWVLETLANGIFINAGGYLFSPMGGVTDALFELDKPFVLENPSVLAIQNQCLVRVTAAGPRTGSGYVPRVDKIACGVGNRMTRDHAGNIFSANGRSVLQVGLDGTVSEVACVPRIGFQGDCRTAKDSDVAYIRDLAVAPNGDIYVVEGGTAASVDDALDPVASVLWRIRGNTVTPLTGSPFTRGSMDTWQNVYLEDPLDLTFDRNGDLLVYDNASTNGSGTTRQTPRAYQLLRFAKSGLVSTVAGNGQFPFKEGVATNAQIGGANGIATDAAGNSYLSIWSNPNRIARVTPSGLVSSLVTTSGLDPFAQYLQFHNLAVNPDGSFYVAAGDLMDAHTPVVGTTWTLVKAVPPNLITLADGSVPKSPTGNFDYPTAVEALAADRWGNIFYGGVGCAEFTPTRQKVSLPSCGTTGQVVRMAVDDLHNLYFVIESQVFMGTPDGHTYRLAGPPAPTDPFSLDDGTGFDGDGGPAAAARLFAPGGITLGPDGALYIADVGNRRIRKMTRAPGVTPQVALSDIRDAVSGKPATWTAGEIITISGQYLNLGSIELADGDGNVAFLDLLPGPNGSWTAILPSVLKPGSLRITIVNSDGRGTILQTNLTGSSVSVAKGVSAASYAALPVVAPDSLVACFGKGLAPSTVAATTSPLPTELNGTQVQITDATGASALALLVFVSDGQIDYLVPAATATGLATFQVIRSGTTVATGILQINRIAPGIFTANADGAGVPAAQILTVKGDTQSYDVAFQPSTNSGVTTLIPKPIDLSAGSVYLLLYGTGIRGLQGGVAAVTAAVNGVSVQVVFAGAQPDFAGLDQINIGPFPATLKGAVNVPLQITVEGQAANRVLLRFQ